MNRTLKWLFAISLLGGLWHIAHRPPSAVLRAPGVLVAEVPEQSALHPGDAPFAHGRFQLEPVARYRIRARVLSREPYRFDAGAELSPLDFALGWGRMSDTAVLEQLVVSQGVRFFSYRWSDQPPLPPHEIIVSAANVHLIPADASVLQALDHIAAGQIVELEGWLVNARRDDGWAWRSSTTREDTGGGACELLFVRAVQLLD